jgi:hypothetical protein
MNCIIHIGLHKTGSTSVQLSLSRAREKLARFGILYPAISDTKHDEFVCHHQLASDFNGVNISQIERGLCGPNLENLMETVDLTAPNFLVLSSEAFSDNKTNISFIDEGPLFSFLRDRCRSISVVAVIRPQVEILQSAYLEGVMSFFNYESFSNYRSEAILDPFFNYAERLKPWIDADGLNFCAIPLNSTVNKERLTETVLHAGGIPMELLNSLELQATGNLNNNPGVKTIAALRFFIQRHPEFQFDKLKEQMKQWVYMYAKRKNWDSVPFFGYTNNDLDQVLKHFSAMNSAFAQLLWGVDWDSLFDSRHLYSRKYANICLENIDVDLEKEFFSFIEDFERHAHDLLGES